MGRVYNLDKIEGFYMFPKSASVYVNAVLLILETPPQGLEILTTLTFGSPNGKEKKTYVSHLKQFQQHGPIKLDLRSLN